KHEKRWSLHDLRRTFSTSLNDMGVDFYVVEQLLGHTIKGVPESITAASTYPKNRKRWTDGLITLMGWWVKKTQLK
ncbi:TPA: tyrosine-type recombinase/integrase, partial [Klebsiella variicola]